MKIKYLILVSLILAIITIGAVSAADNADALAADNDAGDAISQVDEEDVVADGENLGDEPTEDTQKEVNKYVDIPEKAMVDGEYGITVTVYDQDITGNITVKMINGEEETEIYSEKIIPYKSGYYDEELGDYIYSTGVNFIPIKDLGIQPGKYNLKVSYDGDENYLPFNVTGTLNYYFMDVYLDNENEILYNGFNVEIVENAQGNVEVWFDDEFFANYTAEDISEYGISLRDLSYSNHTYKVYYRGDDYKLDEPFEGKFNLTYRFYVDYWGRDVYMDSHVGFEIYYPSDADGEVVITYNGKTITKKIVADEEDMDYSVYVSLTDFNMGENNITFTYKDSKYPEKSQMISISAKPRIHVNYQIRYANDEDAISILLPADAKGNMVIYKVGEWNDTLDDNNLEKLANVSLVNGKANYTLTDLGIGSHNIRVIYDNDDYSEYFDVENKGINVVPDVSYDKYVYFNATNSIKVVVPNDFNGNLTVRVIKRHYNEDYEYVYDYDEQIYSEIVNGTVTVPLPKLEVGSYNFYIYANGQYMDSYGFEVRQNAPEFELNVTFPSEITSEDYVIIVNNIPEDANGHLELYINGTLYDEIYSSDYDLEFDIVGTHTWEIRFVDDDYYKETSKSGTFLKDWVDVPKELSNGESIDVSLEGKEGFIEFKVDGKLYDTELFDEGEAYIDIDDLAIGDHTYEISYYDKNNVKQLTKSGSFKIIHYFTTNIDEEETYVLTNDFNLIIELPEDATGTVTVNVNNKNYTATLVNGTATVILDNLEIGQNNVTITYAGDSKYPANALKEVINIGGYGIYVQNSGEDSEIFEYVSIALPADADGNLTFYKAKFVEEYEYWDGEDEEWVPEHWEIDDENPIKTVKLVNGTAKVIRADFGYGEYDLIVAYVSSSDDYDVDSVDIHFNVEPEVNYTREIVAGENATISVYIENATGKINIYKYVGYDDEIEEPIYELYDTIVSDNGKFEKTISGLPFGGFDFYLEYDGTNMENMFRDNLYSIEVGPKNITFPEEFNSDGTGIITFELPEGASGKVTITDIVYDGEDSTSKVLMENVTYASANKTIAISGLSTGYHNLELTYVDDKNGEFEFSGNVYVPKPDAGADVKLPESVSGDSFDVVLPKDATSGIMVTVDGNTTYIPLINGSAKVDVSKLANGTHTVTVNYPGDGNYSGFEKTVNIDVITPANSKISAPDEFNSDGSGVIAFELPEGSSGKVTITDVVKVGENSTRKVLMENVTYTSANKTIALSGLSAGNHTIELTYVDDKKGVFEFNVDVTVPKQNVSADVKLPESVSGDSFDVVLPKDATGAIMVTVDGNTTYIPLINGTAKVDLSKLADGAHTVTVKYPGDGNYSGFEKTVNMTVVKPVDPKITAANLKVIYSAGSKYTVTVYGTDGKVAANVTVTFLINGKVFKTVTTDAKGIASVKITQKPGTYKITAQALGKSVVKTLTVKHVLKLQKVKVKRSAKKLVIKATLAKVNGKYLKGKKITLKFKGKKYTAKTNKKGVAKFIIKKNVLKKLKKGKKVKYQATYLKDTIKYTVKVKK